MIATATSLPVAVLYLLLFFAEFLGGGGDITADYLQEGSPLSSISVTRLPPDASGILRVVAESDGEEPIVYTVEASDLVGYNYLVYAGDGSIPIILNLSPVLARANVARVPVDWMLDLPGDAELASAGVEVDLGSTVHFLWRGGAAVVSAPDPGIILVLLED